jgi:peptide/nickel transport system permease protein
MKDNPMSPDPSEDQQRHAAPGSTEQLVSLAEVEDAKLAASTDRSRSQASLVWKRFLHHRPAMISAVILGVVILISITSIGVGPIPGWWPYDWKQTTTPINGGAPSAQHWFGQDDLGRDYFALTMQGTRASLVIAFLVGIVGTVLGTIIGAIAGYFRGWVDSILMRITDIFFVVPLLLIAAIVGRIAGEALNSPWFLGILLGAVSWQGLARLVRSQVLSLREREYVDAARAMGAGTWRIIVKHLIPNTIGTVLVNATLAIAAAVLLETSLSFLGYGVRDPHASLGLLISNYQNSFTTRPWLFWWPGLLILLVALTVNFIGDGLRDAFDPRQAGVKRRRLFKFGRVDSPSGPAPSAVGAASNAASGQSTGTSPLLNIPPSGGGGDTGTGLTDPGKGSDHEHGGETK